VKWFRSATPLAAVRWVVVDTETSGLDPRRDRLLAVGAVAVRGGRIELGESFSALLRQDEPSTAQNILVHGIGGDAQLSGIPAAEAIAGLQRFLGDAVPVAFHAPFDAAVLARAGLTRRGWLDLDPLARALFPQGAKLPSLDDWLERFGIEVGARHDATHDALATAELLLVLLAAGERQGITTLEGARAAARGSRWLAG